MVIGIDASNISIGGGLGHLKNLLAHISPEQYGISEIVVWGPASTLRHLPSRRRVRAIPIPDLQASLFRRLLWHSVGLTKQAREAGCNVLLILGGIYFGRFRPFVSIIQNMQVFEWRELKREGLSKEAARLIILQIMQGLTCIRADALIFLSQYSIDYFRKYWNWLIKDADCAIVPHGVDEYPSRKHHIAIESCSPQTPFRLLCVSTVKQYKHQWVLVEAVSMLRRRGFPVHLDLVGGGDHKALRRMETAIQRHAVDDIVSYHGEQTHERALRFYEDADLFIFPSTCEAFGIALLEAMRFGLPIACSRYGPMPELAGESGAYFDPLDPNAAAEVLQELIKNVSLRRDLASSAVERAKRYTWKASAERTMNFLFQTWKRS